MKAWAAKLLPDDVPDHNNDEQDITMVAIMTKRDGVVGPIIAIYLSCLHPQSECRVRLQPQNANAFGIWRRRAHFAAVIKTFESDCTKKI